MSKKILALQLGARLVTPQEIVRILRVRQAMVDKIDLAQFLDKLSKQTDGHNPEEILDK
jgi:hypothetical protein